MSQNITSYWLTQILNVLYQCKYTHREIEVQAAIDFWALSKEGKKDEMAPPENYHFRTATKGLVGGAVVTWIKCAKRRRNDIHGCAKLLLHIGCVINMSNLAHHSIPKPHQRFFIG